MSCHDHLYRNANPQQVTRRWFFEQCGVGLGAMALGQLLGDTGYAAPGQDAASYPMAPRQPHFVQRAKNVIFLFMAGAPSHLEMFDFKPQLAKFDGTLPPPELLEGYRAAFINPSSKLLGPKFTFSKHGQSGTELSELLPYLAEVVDDIAIVKSITTDAFNHAPQPRSRSDSHEHGVTAVRPAQHGRLADLRAGQRITGTPGLCRVQFRDQRAERRELQLG